MKPAPVAAIVSIISAVATATLYLSFNDWFGASDLLPMFLAVSARATDEHHYYRPHWAEGKR